jgi:hypothetical protein
MSADLKVNSNRKCVTNYQPVLYLALELGCSKWKLAFASAPAEKPRRREVEARNWPSLLGDTNAYIEGLCASGLSAAWEQARLDGIVTT